ncbi:MAG: hypothetical protein QOJ44_63, partial [Acidimicrobiaceae bacterium]|nr:hypothetical protein [Acidimicrobiaceae bacterium]
MMPGGVSFILDREVRDRRGSVEEMVMRSLARWSLRHRLAVLGIWLLVLVGTFLIQSVTGSTYASSTKLSGTPSAAAANL